MEESTLTEAVRKALLVKLGRAWDTDAQTTRESRMHAMAAIALIRDRAGNRTLDMEGRADLLDLTAECALYIANGKRAEFLAAYQSELLTLRLREGFGVGKYEDTDL